jgi:hypothetical protein
MDAWTDLDIKSYMAIIAHWVQGHSIQTSHGLHETLSLHADLIGFITIPGSHTGDCLVEIFIFVINHLNIAKKVDLFEKKLNLSLYHL